MSFEKTYEGPAEVYFGGKRLDVDVMVKCGRRGKASLSLGVIDSLPGLVDVPLTVRDELAAVEEFKRVHRRSVAKSSPSPPSGLSAVKHRMDVARRRRSALKKEFARELLLIESFNEAYRVCRDSAVLTNFEEKLLVLRELASELRGSSGQGGSDGCR